MRGRRRVSIAVVNEATERTLKTIDAMLADRRFKSKRALLLGIQERINSTGASTPGQRELIDTILRKVEGQ